MTDIKCKCGHLKSEHRKTIIHTRMECNNCQCFKYLRFNRPDLMDKIYLIVGVFTILTLIFVFFSLYYFITEMPLQVLIDSGINLKNLILVFMFGFFILAIINQSGLITDYLKYRKRKTFDLA